MNTKTIINRNFEIFLILCTKREINFVTKFLAEFVVAHAYEHNLVEIDILKELKTAKNIEEYIIKNYNAHSIFNAIDSDEDKKYVLETLVSMILK